MSHSATPLIDRWLELTCGLQIVMYFFRSRLEKLVSYVLSNCENVSIILNYGPIKCHIRSSLYIRLVSAVEFSRIIRINF